MALTLQISDAYTSCMNLPSKFSDHVRHIVVHGNCPDGLASAILAKDAIHGAAVSGAEMAFQDVWLPASSQTNGNDIARAQRFARLAGIRDLWRNADPDWEEACAQASCLTFYASTDWLTHELAKVWWFLATQS